MGSWDVGVRSFYPGPITRHAVATWVRYSGGCLRNSTDARLAHDCVLRRSQRVPRDPEASAGGTAGRMGVTRAGSRTDQGVEADSLPRGG